ncbi:hypothetical protein SmJEL517_g03225 [Synchytrium microbalum]|uniref:mannan endo-1,4-beta-mannosidase n=1 Tax=Synchytrium microbalum TaxID=1806994 RepID=A0A507C7E8_9FUNG|nr:uncharacterized protein SmJEL517_g03225 [Synchytrium microbalum]TPX33994.1 hypothetical protein SmJEL517_g03225 [Synchytrium microbalum]
MLGAAGIAQAATSCPCGCRTQNGTDWVYRDGADLKQNGQIFKWASVNVMDLGQLIDRPGYAQTTVTPYEAWDALKAVSVMGGRVARIYEFSIYNSVNPTGDISTFHWQGPGKYNEALFQSLDSTIATANFLKVKLIIGLIDWWWWRGGCADFVQSVWNTIPAKQGWTAKSMDFYTDADAIAEFKNFLKWIVNRKNTVSGLRYGDDPAILAWELGNEAAGWNQITPPAWTKGIARYIKTVAGDPNHLILDGTIGGEYGLQNTDGSWPNPSISKWQYMLQQGVLSDACVDIFNNHYYSSQGPTDYANRALRDVAIVRSAGKPFIVGEYGFADKQSYDNLNSAATNNGVTATMIWNMNFHSRDGGWYVHSEGNGYLSYHFPGFATSNSSPFDEIDVMSMLRNWSRWITGTSFQTLPVPDAPDLSITSSSPRNMKWRGSPGAQTYQLQRGLNASGPFTVVASGITDNVPSGSTIYNDYGATCGVTYYYRLQACSEGGCSIPSAIRGPIKC